jgi:hypothetical protein
VGGDRLGCGLAIPTGPSARSSISSSRESGSTQPHASSRGVSTHDDDDGDDDDKDDEVDDHDDDDDDDNDNDNDDDIDDGCDDDDDNDDDGDDGCGGDGHQRTGPRAGRSWSVSAHCGAEGP